jgi:crotonobetaine/carnitine-CoA ligase
MILTEPEFVERIVDARSARLETIAIVGEDAAVSAEPLRVVTVRAGDRTGVPVPRRELDETAVMYTSGTTGPSKGAVISERHAYEYANAAAELVELREGDVYYAPLPLFHIAGQWAVVYACLQRGACAVLKRRFTTSAFWDDVRGHGVTVSFLLGAMAQFLLNIEPAATDGDNLLDRVMMVPLVEDVDRFRERFGTRVSTCFGSTESNVPLASDFAASMATGAGRPRAGFDVRLVDADGSDVAPGGTGELLVRAHEPGVTLLRYLGNDEATANAIRDGWLHTGDVFRLDAGGNYHFSDRLKDSLRKRGENISSFEVEREIQSHPAVQFCAVVGVDSEYSEQEIAAFVQLVPGASVTEDEIRAHVAARAPKFMVPDRVIFVDGFSLTATGKIQKFPLRDKLQT